VDGKTAEEIADYAKVFWKKYKTIQGWERHINVIEEGEDRTRKIETQRKLLALKLKQTRNPLQQMKINYTVSTTNKKVYTEEEDRFLLVMLDKHGIDTEGIYEKIREEIRDSPLFRFDWFFLSRTPIEISRRCTTLLTTVTREWDSNDGRISNGKGKRPLEEEEEEEVEDVQPKKKAKNGVAPKNKQIANVKGGSKATSTATSRAPSVVSNSPAPVAKASKSKGKKK